jgi:hypothetical protein
MNTKLYVLWDIWADPALIGIYSTLQAAEAALERHKAQFVNSMLVRGNSDYEIYHTELDKDDWEPGKL